MNTTDYANWTYELPSKPTLKDWKQLKNKLLTYANSTKFLRLGSTVDLYDPLTGKRVKRPIRDVYYKQNWLDLHGVAALDLRNAIRLAVRTGDKQALKDVASYKYYTADRFKTAKLVLKLEDKDRRKRVLIMSLVLGGAGASLGVLPIIAKTKENRDITKDDFLKSLAAGGVGLGAGLGLTGLILLFRS